MHGPVAKCAARITATGDGALPILAALKSYGGQIIDLDEGRIVDGRELAAGADAVAQWLRGLGLEPGDRAVFSISNGPAFTAAFCGVLAAGGSPIVLHGDTPVEELRRYAHNYSARFILSEHDCSCTTTQSVRCQPTDWLGLHCIELPLDPNGASFPSLPATPLHPTSGTTGRAKLAVRTAVQAVEEARHYIDTMQITADDSILCVVPMSHAYGFGMGFMVSLLSGARLMTMRQFNPRVIARVLAEQRITIFPAAPAMLDLVVRALPEERPAQMPRLVLAAGAPLAEATASSFRQQTGAPVTPLYGTTETGGITVAVGELGNLPTGGVGRPMHGVEARIAPMADAAELARDVGRVMIRSSSMMSGYLTPQGIDTAGINDGWFETGDLGRLDEQGRIQLVGREKEVINVFGMKVVPSEVEEVIAALRGVRDVKVYAAVHRSGSEIVKAAVAVDGDINAAQIRSHCEANLAPYKRPQVVHLVEELPRSPMGKILRDQLP